MLLSTVEGLDETSLSTFMVRLMIDFVVVWCVVVAIIQKFEYVRLACTPSRFR